MPKVKDLFHEEKGKDLFHNKKRLFHNIGVRYRLLFSDIISISMGKEVILCELLSVMMKNPWGRY